MLSVKTKGHGNGRTAFTKADLQCIWNMYLRSTVVLVGRT